MTTVLEFAGISKDYRGLRPPLVFHAGTALQGERLVTYGGRILNVSGTGETIGEARAVAYAGCDAISFAGARHRTDIALAAAAGDARDGSPDG